jgi:hypothetical protein
MSNNPGGASLGNAQGNISINTTGVTGAVPVVAGAAQQISQAMGTVGTSANAAAAQAGAALGGLEEKSVSLLTSVENLGGRGFSSVARLAQMLGDSSLATGVRFASEISIATSGLTRFADRLLDVGTGLAALDGPLGDFTKQGGDLAEAFIHLVNGEGPLTAGTVALASSIGALASVLLPIAGVVADLLLVSAAETQALKNATTAEQSYVDGLQAEIDLKEQALKLSQTASTQQLDQQESLALKQGAILKDAFDKNLQDIQDLKDHAARALAGGQPEAALEDRAKIDVLQKQQDELLKQITDNQKTYNAAVLSQDDVAKREQADLDLKYQQQEADTKKRILDDEASMTEDARQKRLADIQVQIDSNAALFESLKKVTDGHDKYSAQMNQLAEDNKNLTAEQDALNTSVKDAINARTSATQGVSSADFMAKQQQEIATLQASGTHDEFTKKKQALEDQKAIDDAAIATLKSRSDASSEIVQKQIEKLQADSQNASDALALYDRALELTTLGHDKDTQAAKDTAQTLDGIAQEKVNLAKLERDGTVKQFDDQKQALEDQKAAYQDQIRALNATGDTSKTTTDKVASLQGEIAKTDAELGLYTQAVRDTTSANEAARQAEADRTKEIQDAVAAMKSYDATAAQMAKNQQTYTREAANAQADEDARVADEKVNFAKKQQQADAKFNQTLLDDDQTQGEKRAKEIADFNRQQTDAVTTTNQKISQETDQYHFDQQQKTIDHLNALAKIEADTQKNVKDAARNLDAVGVQRAIETGNQQIQNENDRYSRTLQTDQANFQRKIDQETQQTQQESDKRAADFAQKLADEDQQYAESRQKKVDQHHEQMTIDQQNFQDQLDQEAQNFNRQRQQRYQAYLQQQADLQASLDADRQLFDNANIGFTQTFQSIIRNFQNALNAVQVPTGGTTYGGAISSADVAGVTGAPSSYSGPSLQNVISSVGNTIGGITSGISSFFQNLLSFDEGGFTPGGIVQTHPNELILNQTATQTALSQGLNPSTGQVSRSFGDVYVVLPNAAVSQSGEVVGSIVREELEKALREVAQ